jgi:16S rRNA uridine-516 pseudouridylate synthase and related pseudouridylate synthases
MNDGDLAARLTHPSHGVARVYEARVLGIPDAHDVDRLQRGMTIDGQRVRAAEVTLLPAKRDATGATLVITLREGRNRQVRNMCDAIGHPVSHLRRVAIGPIRDSKLKIGFWRDLGEDEVERLRKAAAPGDQHKGHKGDKGHKGKTKRSQP